MKLSVCLTINNRMPETCRAVSDSLLLPGNRPEEVIVVLDRPEPDIRKGAIDAYSRLNDHGILTRFVNLEGKSGWRCPSMAWNAAFGAATGDAIYCLSSETIQSSGSMDEVRHLLITRMRIIFPKVVCSCRPQGHAIEADGTPTGNTLSSADFPRPVGYIWATHRSLVLSVGGYDQAFNNGIGHEDTDMFLRFWDLGMEFEFTDAASGLHICHDQPQFKGEERGLQMAKRNLSVFMYRYGTLDPWAKRNRKITSAPGITLWEHTSDG